MREAARLFGLCEQEHDPETFWTCDLPLCFLRSWWSCRPVAGFVVTRLSIHQDYVAMGAIGRNVI
jgi:hypothetical protein